MRNIQDRKNDIPYVFTGINREINKNKINMHLAERNLGKNIKGEEWDTLLKVLCVFFKIFQKYTSKVLF